MKVFYDTCSLLEGCKGCFKDFFYISVVTLEEIENIKVSNKDEEIKYKARKISHYLEKYKDKYEIILYDNKIKTILKKNKLQETNDNIILATAKHVGADVIYSEDLNCRLIGRNFLGLNMTSFYIEEQKDEKYVGYKQVRLSESDIVKFYSNLTENKYNCLINQYLIIYTLDGSLETILKWNGKEFIKIKSHKIKNAFLGEEITPKDEFQRCAIDSLYSNDITVLSGMPGSGKTFLSLSTALNLVEVRKFDRITIMSNPIVLRGAEEIGFLPGSAQDKLLSGNLGNILISKLGDRYILDSLLTDGKIQILNMGDCRGYEAKKGEILYCTEIQNSTIDLMKIIMSRVTDGAKLFLEGDYCTQVDSRFFSGKNNGLKRIIEVGKNEPIFGHIDLPIIYRGKIAELAMKL